MSGQAQPRSATARLVGVHPLLLVGVGGALGSVARHGTVLVAADPSVAVLVLNIVGSLALGSTTAWLQHSESPLHGRVDEAKEHWAALLGLGLCGGLTTFSTHVVDVARHLDASRTGAAVLSLIATAFLTIVAAGAGYEGTRRLAAIDRSIQ